MSRIPILLVAAALFVVACAVPQPLVAVVDFIELPPGTSAMIGPLENDRESGRAQLLATLSVPDVLVAEVLPGTNIISVSAGKETPPDDYPLGYEFADAGGRARGTVIVRVTESLSSTDSTTQDSNVADDTAATTVAPKDDDSSGVVTTAPTDTAAPVDTTESPNDTTAQPPDTTDPPPPLAAATLDPTSFQLVRDGPAREVTLTNTGGTTVSPSITFDPSKVEITTNTCFQADLAPGQADGFGASCSFVVSAAESADGLYDTTIEVSADQLSGPMTIEVMVDWREPAQLVIDAPNVDLFDEGSAEVTLRNSGGIELPAPAATNEADMRRLRGTLRLDPHTCSDGIPAFGSCTVRVELSEYPEADPLDRTFELQIVTDDQTAAIFVHFYPFIR